MFLKKSQYYGFKSFAFERFDPRTIATPQKDGQPEEFDMPDCGAKDSDSLIAKGDLLGMEIKILS